MFEGGNSKRWKRRLSFCGLEPGEMEHDAIWGHSDRRDCINGILKAERQLEHHQGINKTTGRIITGGIQMGN